MMATSPETRLAQARLTTLEALLPLALRKARGKPLEAAVLNAMLDAQRAGAEISQRIDDRSITFAEATERLVAVHEARKAAVYKLPRSHPMVPILMEFIAERGAQLAHLMRDRGDHVAANMVLDGDRRMMAVLGILR